MRRAAWVVYAKKPFGGPAQVLAYLGRYTHQHVPAIANSRTSKTAMAIMSPFAWKDYRDGGAVKTICLKPDEFIRHFHCSRPTRRLPSHSPLPGFLANGHRRPALAFVARS